MQIKHVIGREIFDSRGLPTIECELVLKNNESVRASVPSGMSRSQHAAINLYDGDERLMGLGVSKAIEQLEQTIAPLLIDQEPKMIQMDAQLIELDGTANKSRLGANTMLAASTAIAKANALILGVQPYEFIAYSCNFESVTIPFPMFNLINGGKHADNNLAFQEIMLVPFGFQTFKDAMEATILVHYTLRDIIQEQGMPPYVGDEGGFCAGFKDEKEALDMLMRAVEQAGFTNADQYKIAIDVAASQIYNHETGLYQFHNQQMNSNELIDYYATLAQEYPIFSIEDGLDENDREGWKCMYEQLGDSLQLVGDDIFASHPERIANGINEKIANAAIIKPNQVGTITEALQAILLCKEYKLNTIVSHRSGETEDTFIVDFAVGANAGQIKAGGCTRGERITKYNRLLRIEDILHRSLLGV